MMVGETLKEMVSRLEEMVGDWSSEDDIVSAWAAYISNELDVQKDLAELKPSMWRRNSLTGKLKFRSGWRNLDG